MGKIINTMIEKAKGGSKRALLACEKLKDKLSALLPKIKNSKVAQKISALILALTIAITPISITSCSDEEVQAVNADTGIVYQIEDLMDDVAKNYTEENIRLTQVNSVDAQVGNTATESALIVKTDARVGSKKDIKDVTFTLAGNDSNYAAIKNIDQLAKDYCTIVADASKTDNDKNTAFNNYLTAIYNLISANVNNKDFTVTNIADKVEEVSLKELIKKNDAVMAQVIMQSLSDLDNIDANQIQTMLDFKELSASMYTHTGAIISNKTDRKTGETTIVYRVSSSFGANSFSINYTLKSKANLTPELAQDIVIRLINGEAVTEDVAIIMDNFNWANATHVAIWQATNTALNRVGSTTTPKPAQDNTSNATPEV